MANKKISELPYINGGKISGNTLVPLVTYFSATTGDTVHTFVDDFQTYLISGLTGNTDVFVTGGTYSAGTITFTNNTGGTFNVTGLTTGSTSIISGEYLPLSGGTVTGSTEFTAGLSANTISATTYLNLPITTDVFVTGGTYSAGTSTFTNNTGGTFNVTGFYTGETSYVNSLNTGVGLSADTTTGDITIINTDPDQTVVLNNGTNINVTGTYPNFTIDVTGLTDFNTFTTGFTYSSNTFTISDNSGSTFNATFTDVTGLTVNGDLNITGTTYSNVISATTYQNLPITTDVFVTGGTYSAGTSTFTNNTGGTFSVSGFVTGDTYVTGLTFNTGNYNLTIGRNDGVSFTDSLAILASDLTVTGGTYDPNTGIATFTNNTGGTFNVTGFLTGFTDTFVTGGTYSNGTATFTNTSGGTFNVSGFYTGGTDVFVTGGTFSAGTATFTNNTGGTFSVTGITSSSGPFGISNSAGTYTYYSTLQSAISAATSGQVVELFADITETSGITVNLKNGVNINGNGHSYTLNNTGSTSCLSDGGASVTCNIVNIKLNRIGVTNLTTTGSTCLLITGISKINVYGSTFYGSRAASLILNNSSAEVIGADAFGDAGANGYTTILVTSGTLINSKATNNGNAYYAAINSRGRIINCVGTATSIGNGIYVGAGLAENCTGNVLGGDNFCYGFYNEAHAIKCIGYSTTSVGFYHYINSVSNGCIGYSTANVGFATNTFGNLIENCIGYSTASVGINVYNGHLLNCVGVSTANYGIQFTNGGDGQSSAINCTSYSSSAAAVNANVSSGTPLFISNCTFWCGWNSANGHAIIIRQSGYSLVNSTLRTTAGTSNSINGSTVVTLKYVGNIYSGPTTPVSSNVTQSVTNTHDNQGNILI